MPSRLTNLAILAALVAIIFSPFIASVSDTLQTEVKAPPKFVRDKVLEYDFVRGALLRGSVPIDAIILKRNEHTFGATHAKRNEYLQVEVPGSGKLRGAKAIRNRKQDFAYSEDFPLGQKVVHTLRFNGAGGARTKLEYEKKWKGSLALYLLGQLGYVDAVGVAGSGDLEGVRRALEEAFEEERETWGVSRYD